MYNFAVLLFLSPIFGKIEFAVSSKLFFTFLFLVSSINASIAQSVSSFNYSVKDGLPSSEVHFSLKDSKNFMWFATDRGLVRFDSKTFETFTTKDGLPGNVIFHLQEDSKGRIWFDTYSGKLGYYENNQFHSYRYNDLIQKQFNTPTINDFYVDHDNSVYLSLEKIGYIKIDPNGNIESRYNDYRVAIEKINSEKYFFSSAGTYSDQISLSLNKTGRPEIFHFKNIWDNNDKRTTLNAFLKSGIYIKEKDEFIFSIKNALFRLNAQGVSFIRKFKFDILDLTYHNKNVYIGFYKQGVMVFSEGNFQNVKFNLISDYSVTNILNHNNEIWLTTLDNGIYHIPNENTSYYSTNHGLPSDYITAIAAGSNQIVIGDASGNITVKTDKLEVHKECEGAVIENIIFDPNNNQFIISGPAIYRYKDNTLSQYNIGHQIDLKLTDNEILLYSKNETVINSDIFKEYKFKYISKKGDSYGFINNKRRVFSEFIEYKNSVYLGSLDGLLVRRGKTVTSLRKDNELLNARIIELEEYQDTLLIATRGKGLVYFTNDTIYNIDKHDGLISDQLTCLHIDNKQRIWVGSSNGVSLISNNQIINFDNSDGIISNEIITISSNDENIFFGTKQGLSIFENKTFIKTNIDVPVVCKTIVTVDSIYGINSEINLNENEPYIEISFIGISYLKSKNVTYRYQIYDQQPSMDKWLFTNNNTIVFSKLESGQHHLVIQASIDEVNWSSIPLHLKMNVAYPFWTDLKIILVSLIILLVLTWVLVKIYVKRLKTREKNALKLHALRMESLNAQMNPHFLFNSLNSIQNYILKNDKKAANAYVSTFAKLIRITLKRSQEFDVRLSEELKALNLYTELEQKRSKYLIDINVNIDPELDIHKIIIPALLIQPIVENAIWHGLIPKQQDGRIEISIKKIDLQLYFTIEDNGVGRDLTKRKHSEDISRGTNLTIERINLFSKTHNSIGSFKIEDLSEGKIKTGTRIKFNIPYVQK